MAVMVNTAELLTPLQALNGQLQFEQTKNAALSLELARLKQWRFGQSSESLDAQGLNPQGQLFDAKTEQLLIEESKAEDRAADAARAPTAKKQAKRQTLPSQLKRIEHHYEIEPAVCSLGHPLKRIGQEISEQLDCIPVQFFVHRQIRGKYACACCQSVWNASMPAQIIDKGIPACKPSVQAGHTCGSPGKGFSASRMTASAAGVCSDAKPVAASSSVITCASTICFSRHAWVRPKDRVVFDVKSR